MICTLLFFKSLYKRLGDSLKDLFMINQCSIGFYNNVSFIKVNVTLAMKLKKY